MHFGEVHLARRTALQIGLQQVDEKRGRLHFDLAAARTGLELHFAEHDPQPGHDDAVLQVERLSPLVGSGRRGRCRRARAGPENDVGRAASAASRKPEHQRKETAIHPDSLHRRSFHT